LREAFFYDGVEVEIRSAHDDTEQQKKDIRYFIDKKVDVLVVAPNEAAPLTAVVEQAFDRGIAVITFDRNILSDKYTAYVGADNYEIGRSVGNYIAALRHGHARVVEISGLTGSTSAMDRHQGFANAMVSYPGIQILTAKDAGWLREEADKQMTQLLKEYSHIDVVYAHNDRMAAGAYDAARRVGREQQITFIGVDALSGDGYGLDMVNQGILGATFLYPTGGDRIVQIAMEILQRKRFPRETILNTAVVDSTNARVMLMQTAEIDQLDSKIETLNNRIGIYLSQSDTQRIIILGGLLFILVVVGLLLIVYRSLQTKSRLNKELVTLTQQLEEATQAKLRFFTNVSHDFRTPLTLVADPVDRLLGTSDLTDEQRRMLQVIKRNVNILLRLVNQILDFRKYENGKLELTLSRIDFIAGLQAWSDSFLPAMRAKHIRFHFEHPVDTPCPLTADAEKIERIYFNLLANAVKFTPENGKITVTLAVQPDTYLLSVANTGSLITAEHIHHIFDRFYQAERYHAGSGIGLALVKAFVELHGGTICVESDEKRGTCFTLELPKGAATSTFASIPASIDSVSALSIIQTEPKERLDSNLPVSASVSANDNPVILIIDDNPDIRAYIRDILQATYTVIEAVDGLDGIHQAMTYVPDVIVSDIMMPGIDGTECCRRLKSELQTSHIPIILLTACSLDEQRAEGYDCGADSYIAKPFDSRVLLSRIRNLLTATQRIRQSMQSNTLITREDVRDIDKEFVEKFKRLIEERLDHSDLNVEELGSEMGLSRVQLYRKIKSLTNYAPNELLRIARLRKAASLLASSGLSISEICYEVGFTSPSYFAKCYKAEYGESPSEIVKRRGSPTGGL
jgi:signal transduction histidine kinase/DNA-binding response OmpR family regulator